MILNTNEYVNYIILQRFLLKFIFIHYKMQKLETKMMPIS